MGLLDVLNGMQNGPHGPSHPSTQSNGGMSPMTMAILALLAWKAVKHFGGSQPSASPASVPVPPPAPASTGGGLGNILAGGLGGLLGGGAAGSILSGGLGDLLKQYGVPYYLKIDIEGHDQYCLDDLNPADLPQYISLELGPFETMLRLQALGYSDFKLMTQNNHTQLVIDMFRARLKRRLQPYPALYGFSRKVAALMRGSGGGDDGNINGTDPINGWQFPFGSSGPFGEETPGEWRTLDDVMFTWTAYQLGYSKYGPPQLGIWHDVHARRQPA